MYCLFDRERGIEQARASLRPGFGQLAVHLLHRTRHCSWPQQHHHSLSLTTPCASQPFTQHPLSLPILQSGQTWPPLTFPTLPQSSPPCYHTSLPCRASPLPLITALELKRRREDRPVTIGGILVGHLAVLHVPLLRSRALHLYRCLPQPAFPAERPGWPTTRRQHTHPSTLAWLPH